MTENRSPSILVVDDNLDYAENLAELMEDLGLAASSVPSATAAREKLRSAPPEIGLIDINLPDGNGLALLKELREARPDALGIILTGSASVTNAIEAVNQGAYAYVLKDSGIDEILAVVRRAVEHARLALENRGLEASLRASEERYRDLIENAPDMVQLLDEGGKIIETNRTMIDRLGYSSEDLKGRRLTDIVAEEHRDRTRDRLREVVEKGIARAESRLVTRSGDPIDVELFATGLRDAGSGRIVQIRCFVRDITEWKRVQRMLVEKERLAAIGQMSATIAHEVRNPLAGISGAIQVLFSQLATDPKKAEILREILARIDRLNAIIGDLLQFARPLVPSPKPVTFDRLARGSLDVLRRDPLLKKVELDVDDDTDGTPYFWDPAQLDVAFTNLVLNSAQAMKGTGRIRLAARRRSGGVEITLDDTGPGFAVEALRSAFTPFFTTKVKGTGLGLAVTRKIVEAHEGTIRVRNKSGREGTGAIVEIVLPADVGAAKG